MIRSWHRPAWLVMWIALLWSAAAMAHAATPLPPSPTPHYIRDDAHWLAPAAFQALDAKLQAFERETSSQFVVAIFPEIPPGEELFDFSQRLYQAWKPGGAEKDNGAIFLIFADDRKLRIHTGFGMEGVLPDARCKQIIQDIVAPKLREGNREAAVNAGVDAMIAAAKGEYTGTGKTRLDGKPADEGADTFLFIITLLVIAALVFRHVFGAADVIFSDRGRSRTPGGWWIGGSSGGGWGGGGGFGGGGGGGGFSGGGGDSGGGGASGDW
ncbi:MAG: TPM domain-containing protein [Verrucomicrobiota bacterium]